MGGNQIRLRGDEPPVTRIAHHILVRAISEGATELRLLPAVYTAGAWSPLLVQGLIKAEWCDLSSIPGVIAANIMRRYKIMADVNPFSVKGPQGGSFRISVETDESQRNDYLIHASFQEGPGGIMTELSIQEIRS